MFGLLSTLYLCNTQCVFAYLRISHLIHGNVITDILESYAFQKYSTCWVIYALVYLRIWVYMCLCICVFYNVRFDLI